MEEKDNGASKLIFITDVPAASRWVPERALLSSGTDVLILKDEPPKKPDAPQVVRKEPSRLSSLALLLLALKAPDPSLKGKQEQNPVYLKKSGKRRW